MNLKNITLKTAELGPIEWAVVEKLQSSENGFVCFVDYDIVTKDGIDGESKNILVGKYIQTDFTHKPSYKEMINFVVSQEYPNGKELQMLRLGAYDPEDPEYLEYYDNVNEISKEIKDLLK